MMSAHTFLFLLTYLCVAVFVAAVVRRVVRLLRMPIHVRWELYPVGHEPGKRGQYGGSYFEEVDWWTKPRHTSLVAEAKYMGPEIILLRGVWENNRPLWFLTFPFHFGLYTLIANLVLVIAGGVAEAFGAAVGPGASWLGAALHYLTILTGYIGFTLGLFGAVALLWRRITDPDLRDYTSFMDYVNLVLFVVTLGTGLLAWLFVPDYFEVLRRFVAGLFTFTPATIGSSLAGVAIALGIVTIAYVPLTHMSHFFTKYFMYHHVRWNDEPNHPGSKIEQQVDAALGLKPTWAGPHMGADGTKTWAEIAMHNPTAEGK